ncbi:MAG TPA: hypothetical protein PLY87_24555 [Planctomycetaceae bacterium]|nr:hypothetical protein [Planctomycetaceae bacterium]
MTGSRLSDCVILFVGLITQSLIAADVPGPLTPLIPFKLGWRSLTRFSLRANSRATRLPTRHEANSCDVQDVNRMLLPHSSVR